MGGRTKENKAMIRSEAPVDMGLLVQDAAQMVRGSLDLLRKEYAEFQAAGKGVPFKFTETLGGVTDALNTLTLAHARYTKTQKEWADKLSPEEKLANLRAFLLDLYTRQPEVVVRWLTETITAVNNAGDSTKAEWNQRKHRVSVDELLDNDELIDDTDKDVTGGW